MSPKAFFKVVIPKQLQYKILIVSVEFPFVSVERVVDPEINSSELIR